MLNVGDVVFLLDRKEHTVVPCRVVEKVNSISLQGENTYHVIETPQGKNIRLEDYKNPWFSTVDEARGFLIEAATSLVDTTIQETIATREKYFPQLSSPADEPNLDSDIPSLEEKGEPSIVVDLGNGQKGRVNMTSGP
jgi:hypothetical protein